jgi:hypothetical protein
MTSPDDKSGIVGQANETDDFRHFVEDMARFTTAADNLKDEGFRIAFAEEHSLKPEEITEEDISAELSEERLYSETMAFWEMIRRARQLVARVESYANSILTHEYTSDCCPTRSRRSMTIETS